MDFWRSTACWVRSFRYSELSFVLVWFSPTWTYNRNNDNLDFYKPAVDNIIFYHRGALYLDLIYLKSLVLVLQSWPEVSFSLINVGQQVMTAHESHNMTGTEDGEVNVKDIWYKMFVTLLAVYKKEKLKYCSVTCVHASGMWPHDTLRSNIRRCAGTSRRAHDPSVREELNPAYSDTVTQDVTQYLTTQI